MVAECGPSDNYAVTAVYVVCCSALTPTSFGLVQIFIIEANNKRTGGRIEK